MKKTIFMQFTGVVLSCLCLMVRGAANDITLCSYEPSSDIISINEISDNLSGVTYNPLTNNLYMVTNSPEVIYQTELDGTVLRTIELNGFYDTEGIIHIEGTRFAVTEERIGNIAFFDIPPSNVDISIDYNDAEIASLADEFGPWEPQVSNMNKGLEGVSYNPATNRVYAVKEQAARYYSFDGTSPFPDPITDVDDFCTNADFGFSDIAGIHHMGLTFLGSMEVLLLGEDDKTLIHIDGNCNEISRLSLDMRQPEGVTMDNNGNIYIVGERNELLILSPNPSLDVDGDGICNADDICPNGDDNVDTNNNGIPDACEICSIGLAGNGDVNLDGTTNIVDALLIAQYTVGVTLEGDCGNLPPFGEVCLLQADINCDGQVNIVDALLIAQCDAGLINGFCPN